MNIRSIIQGLWERSPAENLQIGKARLRLTGLTSALDSRNDMLDPLITLKSFPSIAGWCFSKLPEKDILLLGDARTIESWQIQKELTDKNIHIQNWTWTDGLDTDYSGRIVICCSPYSAEHWDIIWKVNKDNAKATHVVTLGELIAPFLQITVLMKRFDYFLKSVDEVIHSISGKIFSALSRSWTQFFR